MTLGSKDWGKQRKSYVEYSKLQPIFEHSTCPTEVRDVSFWVKFFGDYIPVGRTDRQNSRADEEVGIKTGKTLPCNFPYSKLRKNYKNKTIKIKVKVKVKVTLEQAPEGSEGE